MFESDDDSDDGLSAATLYHFCIRENKRRMRRRFTAHDLCKERRTEGDYVKLFQSLKNNWDETKFFEDMRMSKSTFSYILQRLEKCAEKRQYHNCHRQPILIEERLVVTLQYLATGLSFRKLGFLYRMGHTTVSKIVEEVTEMLWAEFQPDHMPIPTKERFSEIANEFYDLWNFPLCIGAVDGKHIRIKNPAHGASMYYNYKKFFSIVLQALVDANYKYVTVDIGNYGKQADGGTFRHSQLYARLISGRLNLPEDTYVPEGEFKLPHVILADDAYPLLKNVLKPYGDAGLNDRERNFNKRLSRARRVVEHAFGMDRAKWMILGKEVELQVEKAVNVVKSICILHNIIIDLEGVEHHLTEITKSTGVHKRVGGVGRPTDEGKRIREAYADYFYRFKVNKVVSGGKNSIENDEDSMDGDVSSCGSSDE